MHIGLWLVLFGLLSVAAAFELPSTQSLKKEIEAVGNSESQESLKIKKDTLLAVEEIEKLDLLQQTREEEINSASKKEKALQKKLAAPLGQVAIANDLSEEALQAGLNEASAALELAKAALGELREEENRRARRRQQLPEEIARARSATTADLPSVGNEPLATSGDIIRLQEIRSLLRVSREKALTQEQQHLDATGQLLSSHIVAAIRDVDHNTQSVDLWRSALERQRVVDAEDLSQEARSWEDKFSDLPAIADLLASNREMAEGRLQADGINARMNQAQARLAELEASLARLETQRASAVRRVTLLEQADLTIDGDTGNVLRRERVTIPSADHLRERLREGVVEATRAQLQLISLQDKRRATSESLDGEIRDVLAKQGNLTPSRKDELDKALRAILHNRDEINNALISDQRHYIEIIGKANNLTAQLAEESAGFARFIDERLLWIRNAGIIHTADFNQEADGLRSFLVHHSLLSVLKGTWEDIRRSPALWMAALGLILLLALKRTVAITLLETQGEIAIKRKCTSFIPTVKALGHSFLLAAPIPLFIAFFAWRCGLQDVPFKTGIINVGIFLTLTGLIWTFARRGGLFTNHLGMEPSLAIHIRRHLRWFVPLMLLPIFFSSVLSASNYETTVGRLFFIVAMLLVAAFGFLLLRPSRQLIPALTRYAWLPRLSFLAAVVLPLGLAIGAALGYFSSVQLLRAHIMLSLWVGIGVLLLASLLSRLILVSRRQLSIKQALSRRTARARKLEEGESGSREHLPSVEEVMAQAVDVSTVNQQARHLLRMGSTLLFAFLLYAIWSNLLPALSVLDRVPLWSENGSIATGLVESSGGGELLPSIDSATTENASKGTHSSAQNFITLQNLLAAVVIFLLTFILARNVPALLELTILSRLTLAPGGSFAITTSIRYLILFVGVVWGFSQIGITWGKVQWIAAAVTLGIGFGLQEVFANFVAGIILLFERPMRIGDYVTVGELSGQVTRIEMRATTIRDFSHKELVVPNKEFITGQLINWTLSDAIVRIEIPVGVAYGSDTELIKETLKTIALATPQALDDPGPQVIFKGFGDSTLDFELRIHITGADEMVGVKSTLHFAIDQAFRKANIEIAFPQQDLHIRSMPQQANS